MNMHDNDLDQLFRSKLDDFEMVPSKNLWAGIAEGLDAQEPRKKRLIPMLRIAASVAVVVTAGVLFYPKNNGKSGDKPKLTASTMAATTQGQSSLADPAVPVSTVPVVNSTASSVKAPDAVVKQQIAAVSHQTPAAVTGTEQPAVSTNPQTTMAVNDQPATTDIQKPILAAVDPPKAVISAGSVPDDNINLTPVNIDTPSPLKMTPALSAQVSDKPAKKHHIHNFGDLVNVVVAKVDKRADKVVEFTENDDESNITGINLGFLKIKKDK